MKNKNTNWTRVPMYCPNCGNLNYGYKDSDTKVRYECDRCTLVVFRTYRSRREETLLLIIPAGLERLEG